MNRFDRVTLILLLLQTRSVVTARFLSEHFDVAERTIYRDIRTLGNAGVPIGAEAARFVGEWRYMFGFVDEGDTPDGVKMRFLTRISNSMARWLPHHIADVENLKWDTVREPMKHLDLHGVRFEPMQAAPPPTLLCVRRLALPKLMFEIEADAAD